MILNSNSLYIPLRDRSVHCAVTSPPYWGLRKYSGDQRFEWPSVTYTPMSGVQPLTIPGCDPGCDHKWGNNIPGDSRGGSGTPTNKNNRGEGYGRNAERGNWCQRCGGWRGELGLEPTPELFVAHIVAVFREVWRVLRDDGVLFLNFGDTYYSNPGNGRGGGSTLTGGHPHLSGAPRVQLCDSDGTAESDYPGRDCPLQSQCGVRTDSQCFRMFDNALDPVRGQALELCQKIQDYMAELLDHLPTEDYSHQQQTELFSSAILDLLQTAGRVSEQLLDVLASTTSVFSQQHLEGCHLWHSLSVFLLRLHSFSPYVREFARRNQGDLSRSESTTHGIRDKTDDAFLSALRSVCKDMADGCYSVCDSWLNPPEVQPNSTTESGKGNLKPKDLCGIPWRVALALQADGWWLRQDIVWAKGCSGEYTGGSVMPESIIDRCVKSHEYMFLLSKSARYFFDHHAIREQAIWNRNNNEDWQRQREITNEQKGCGNRNAKSGGFTQWEPSMGRNRRSVWVINPEGYEGAHYATMPSTLVVPCVKAGTSEYGVCPICGAPWGRTTQEERVVESLKSEDEDWNANGPLTPHGGYRGHKIVTTLGWKPTCGCGAEPTKAIVLDPFCGSGTVGEVCNELGRKFVGLDLSFKYLHDNALERAEGKSFVKNAEGETVMIEQERLF